MRREKRSAIKVKMGVECVEMEDVTQDRNDYLKRHGEKVQEKRGEAKTWR